ncbi:succinylglutamate desuccinylase/aspartoacylase family protein [Candidatus Gottesmanbacteria bacterium]|nr:succinylglutamate desuccinylase/aspartoacylase family protein [Candidatus Gottesmanbacteria bacterium]
MGRGYYSIAMTINHIHLGEGSIDVPVFDIVGKKPGKTLLVTGGMDGDEYAGMEACYRTIKRINAKDIAGRIIIIPIVNTPGFWEETSSNPMDGKFPKFVGVGKALGSPTQRLVHWLVNSYAKHADLWLDLHGGSLTECISPYLWAWETGVDPIDSLVKEYIQANAPGFGIFERQRFPTGKAATLARAGCGYILGEAGGMGSRAEADIHQHETWISAALELLEIMQSGQRKKGFNPVMYKQKTITRRTHPVLYAKTDFFRSTFPGLWYPYSPTIRTVQKGEPLGVVRSLDGKKSTVMAARHTGQILWIKSGLRAMPTDDLVAIAYNTII